MTAELTQLEKARKHAELKYKSAKKNLETAQDLASAAKEAQSSWDELKRLEVDIEQARFAIKTKQLYGI